MGKNMKEFRAIARTKEKEYSPIVSEISFIVPELIDWGKAKFRGYREKKQIHQNLFRFLNESYFFIGRRKGDPPSVWSDYDQMAVKEIIDGLPGIFDKPDINSLSEDEKVNFLENLCSLGGPIPNKFTRLIVGLEFEEGSKYIEEYAKYEFKSERRNLPKLKYSFNLCPDERCENKNIDELRSLEPEPSWSIIGKSDEFIPEMRDNRIVRDYGMLIKAKHPDKNARRKGKRVLVVAGCHGIGTMAAGSSIKDGLILEKIWDEIGDRDFQAIIMVDLVGRKGEEHVRQIELIDLIRV